MLIQTRNMIRIFLTLLTVASAIYLTGCANTDESQQRTKTKHRYGYGAEQSTTTADSEPQPKPQQEAPQQEERHSSTTLPPPPPTETQPSTPAGPATKQEYPYGKAVQGKPGFVTSPHAPYSGYVDVRGFPPGTEVKDPYTGKIFLVP